MLIISKIIILRTGFDGDFNEDFDDFEVECVLSVALSFGEIDCTRLASNFVLNKVSFVLFSNVGSSVDEVLK